MDRPFVSVVIPVFNDAANLRVCLERLVGQTYPSERVEILVVDNGSDEPIDELVAQFERTSLYSESRPGSYAARNRGIAAAKSEILAFLDSDCVPAPDWLEKGVARLAANPGMGVVGGRVDFSFGDPENPSPVEIYDSLTSFKQKSYIEKSHFSGTGNLFAWRRVFERVGPFNAELKSGGDYEWGNRVYAHGIGIAYADDVRVTHPARQSLGPLLSKHRRVMGGISVPFSCPLTFLKGQLVEALLLASTLAAIATDKRVGAAGKGRTAAVALRVAATRITGRFRGALGGEAER